ncbi:MAG: hypothetical protein ACJ763_04390 [Bdellovibrionia bacterium]
MKSFTVSLLGVLLSAQAMGATSFPLKSCSSDFKKLDGSGEVIPTTMTVYSEQGEVRGKVTQTIHGQTTSYEDEAQESFYLINHRIDRITPADRAKLNLGEELLVHAYAVTTDPELKGVFSAGLDLKAVQSVRVFQIGAFSEFGTTAIIEAMNDSGAVMGSFIGGLIVSPCK